MTNQIFISYSKKDSDFAHKLANDLKAAGFKIWIDESITGGDQWRETIEKNLKDAGEVIVVVSPNSMASQWVQHEGSLAYGWGKQLFPILIEPTETLPPWLEEYQWIDFVDTSHEIAFDALVAALTPPNPIQDLLDQQVQAYQQTGELIGEAILRVIDENCETLKINPAAQELITQSQLAIEEREQSELEKAQQLARTQRQRTIVLTVGLIVAIVLSIISFLLYGQSNQYLSDAQVANTKAAINLNNANLANTQSAQNLSNANFANTQSVASALEAQAASTQAVWAQNVAEEQLRIARAGQLASQSTQLLDNNLDLALLLSVEAYNLVDNFASLRSLYSGWQYNIPLLRYIQKHDCGVTRLAFNLDNQTVASGCSSGVIKISDATNGTRITDDINGHEGPVVSLAFSPDGQILASGGSDSVVRLWDTSTWEPTGEPITDFAGAFMRLAFHPVDRVLALAECTQTDDFLGECAESQIYRYDIDMEARVGPVMQYPGSVYELTFNADGTQLAAAGCKYFEPEYHSCINGQVGLWDVATGNPITEDFLQSEFEFTSVDFSPTQDLLAAGTCGQRRFGSCTDGQVQFWEIESQSIFTQTLSQHADIVSSVAFSPDGQWLASGSWDSEIVLWEIQNVDGLFVQPVKPNFSGHKARISSIVFSPDGDYLVSGGDDPALIIWNTNVQDMDRTRTQLFEPAGFIDHIAFSPVNGMIAYCIGFGDQVQVVDYDNQVQAEIPLNARCVDLTFNPYGTLLASLDGEGTIQLWDTLDFSSVGMPIDSSNQPKQLYFGQRDDRIYSVSSDEILGWDITDLTLVSEIPFEDKIFSENAVINPVKQLLILSTYDSVVLIDSNDGKALGRYEMNYPYSQPLAISPDGNKVVIAPCLGANSLGDCIRSEIRLLDVNTIPLNGTVFAQFDGYVFDFAFNPDGNMLASGICRSADENSRCLQYEIWLWDIDTGQFYGPPLNVDPPTNSYLEFFQDGKILVSVGRFGKALSWSIDPIDWVKSACTRTGRNLTQAEWQQYFPSEAYRLTCSQ